jgi:hypothetical protein
MTLSRVVSALLAIDLILVVGHTVGIVLRGEPFVILNLDAEANIPAWWSNAKFVVAGSLFMLTAASTRRRALTPVVLGVLLFGLAADEIASVHERIGRLLADNVATDTQFKRKDAFLWPLLLGVPVMVLGGLTLRALVGERFYSEVVWRRIGIALLVFFVGAVGVELIAFNPLVPVPQGSPLYQALAILEEGLEHVGASLLVWGALAAFAEHYSPLPAPTGSP